MAAEDRASNSDPLHQINVDLAHYRRLLELVGNYNFGDSNTFSRYAATIDYGRTLLLDTLLQFNSSDMAIRRMKESIQQQIARMDRPYPLASDYERMLLLSDRSYGLLARQPNRLFLTLPTNVDHWDDANTSTHTFCIYFMCNNTPTQYWTPRSQPYHVHITDHTGYDLDRPQEFLQAHGDHALAVLLMVKYGYRHSNYHVPSLSSFEILKTGTGSSPRHNLAKGTIESLIDRAIEYIRTFIQLDQSSTRGKGPWDIKPFLRLDDNDHGTGDSFMFQPDGLGNQWICKYHFPFDPATEVLQQFVQSLGGTIDLHNNIIKVTLKSPFDAAHLAEYHKPKIRFSEAFVHIAWNSSRNELKEVCRLLVEAKLLVLHIFGVSSSVGSHSPIEFTCPYASRIILHDYPWRNESYIAISLSPRRKGHLGLFLRRQVVDELCTSWENLANYLFDEFQKCHGNVVHWAVNNMREKLARHMACDLSGISVFDAESNIWQGQFGFSEGGMSGLVEASIPCTQFSSNELEYGMLRRLVLQTYHTDDMLQILSLMDFSPALQKIDTPAQGNVVFTRIASIRHKCHGRGPPLEVRFVHHQEKVLARVAIRGKDDSESLETSSQSQNILAVDFLEWHLDHISERLRDDDVQLLESASRIFSSALTSFTLDITTLTVEGLTSICIVLQRSTLEHLHIRCVPFMPFLGVSVGSVLRAIQWSTIKSLVLTGSSIDDWLQLSGSKGNLIDLTGSWVDPSTSGPRLLFLSIIACEQKTVLSHASALAIHHLVHSCPLLELQLKNLELKRRDWDLILGGIHYSILKILRVSGGNIPGIKKYKAVLGSQFQQLKGRVRGSLRMAQHDRGQGRSSKECATQ